MQFTERMQSNGKGSCPNASLCTQVLPNAYAAASRQLANTDQQMAEVMRGATRVSRAIAFTDVHFVFRMTILGNGLNESWSQSTCDSTDNE